VIRVFFNIVFVLRISHPGPERRAYGQGDVLAFLMTGPSKPRKFLENFSAAIFRLAHASRVLATASSPSRTSLVRSNPEQVQKYSESSFRRDAETSRRDACATLSFLPLTPLPPFRARRNSVCAVAGKIRQSRFAPVLQQEQRGKLPVTRTWWRSPG
jgi:hypothetical protein